MTQPKNRMRVHYAVNFAYSLTMLLMASAVGAQQPSDSMQSETSHVQSIPSGNSNKVKSDQPITMRVKDSTISYIVRTIAKQAGLRLSYDSENQAFSKRIDLDVRKVSIMNAMAVALRGTGLSAKMASDRGAILIGGDTTVNSNVKLQESGIGTIAGRITDSASGKPIAGVTIILVGEKFRTVSGENGWFVLKEVTAGGYQLQARAIGYNTSLALVSLAPGKSAIQNIQLVPNATSLSEVVTTATGSQRRVEIGNDIVKLDAAEILERAPARSVSDMLRFAQVPGVSVQTASGEPGAPTKIRIRGIGSISQNSDPAIIVDGIWINSRMSDSSAMNNAWGARSVRDAGTPGATFSRRAYISSPLDNIDPLTIETIEIVKGPSAASLYGQEAANGVIVITTKRGKSGPASWTYSYSRDWDSQVRQSYGNWYGYGTDESGDQFTGSCDVDAYSSLFCTQDSVVNLNRFGNLLSNTGPGSLSSYSAAVRGGIGALNYSLSGSYKDNSGTRRIPPWNLIRSRNSNVELPSEIGNPSRTKDIFVNSTIGFNAGKRLSLDLVIGGNNSRQTLAELEMNNSGGLLLDSMLTGTTLTTILGGSDALSIMSAVSGRLQINDGWNAAGSMGIDIGERRDKGKNEYLKCSSGKCEPIDAVSYNERLRQNSISTKVLTGRLSATGGLRTRFDRFLGVTPSVGLDVRRNIQSDARVALWDVPHGSDQGRGAGTASISSNDVVTAGYYVNGSFKLLDRMYFDLGFRQDAGSVIKMNGSSLYPKFATSWLVSDEGFFPVNKIVNILKLRGAIGYAAVHPDEADLYGKYIYQRSSIDGQIVTVANLAGIGNNLLVPERSLEVEGGFDTYLLEDRAEVTFTVAHKVLRNAIIDRRIPTSSGMLNSSRKENISRVVNRSVEIGVTGRVIDSDWALIQVGANLSNINNVIKKLGNKVSMSGNTEVNRLVEGYPIGSVWDKPLLGYSDINGNGIIETDEVIVGDTTVFKGWNTPKFNAGYNASVSVFNRALTASVSLSQVGPRIQYATFRDNYGEVAVGAPLEMQVLNLVSARNKGAAMNTSEVRLNSASLTYNLPSRFARRLKSKMVSVSLQGSNLGLWTDYKGRDPMVNSTPIGNMTQDDGFTLPVPRKYAFNVRLEL